MARRRHIHIGVQRAVERNLKGVERGQATLNAEDILPSVSAWNGIGHIGDRVNDRRGRVCTHGGDKNRTCQGGSGQ
jgi:hypothetical protein